MRARTPSRAFTLVELMVAMLVASLIGLLVVGVVRTTISVTGEGATDEHRGQREHRVRLFLATQLSWMDLAERPGRASPPLAGGDNWMMTRSLISMRAPHRREPVVARLLVAPDPEHPDRVALFYEERDGHERTERRERERARAEAQDATDPIAAQRLFEEGLDMREMRPLLRGCAEITINYLQREAGGALRWEPDWIGRPGLPRAVRIGWTNPNGDTREWIMPVAVTF